MARTPEGKVDDHLTKRCKALKYTCLKFTAPGTTGVPDRIVIGNGQTVFLELKKPGDSLRRMQRIVVAEMRGNGAVVRVANTKELVDDVLAEVIAGRTHKIPSEHHPSLNK